MSSVTGRVKVDKQPRGGYIKISQFEENVINDGLVLREENLHASIIGLVVDYLTRLMTGSDVKEAFGICIAGYQARMIATSESLVWLLIFK